MNRMKLPYAFIIHILFQEHSTDKFKLTYDEIENGFCYSDGIAHCLFLPLISFTNDS